MSAEKCWILKMSIAKGSAWQFDFCRGRRMDQDIIDFNKNLESEVSIQAKAL
jgi:hypothetical protein